MDWSELLDWSEYVKLLVGLFVLADPIGSVPIVSVLTYQCSREEKESVSRISAITFIAGMIIFSLLGIHLLNLFGITIPALKVAGGILFIFYALEMLGIIQFPPTFEDQKSQNSKFLGVVPIGIPLLVGPGTISKIIIYSDLHQSLPHRVIMAIVVLVVGVIIYIVFRTALVTGAKLKGATTIIITKISGLLLAGISVEFILEGIAEFFPQLDSIL